MVQVLMWMGNSRYKALENGTAFFVADAGTAFATAMSCIVFGMIQTRYLIGIVFE